MGLLSNSNAIESGGYSIDRSLRFRSSASAYLSRTFGTPTAQNTWTLSFWAKIGSVGTRMQPFEAGSTNRLEIELSVTTGQLTIGNATTTFAKTNSYLRDPSAWYHIVIKANGTGAALTIYINGVQATLATSNNLTTSYWNSSGTVHYIGCYGGSTYFYDGYLAEVNFIDGQALTPSSFGEFSTETGVWVPKKYTGTYGTNGFYLDFKDNTSATTLSYDKSGNGNNWTPNNISTTAGATYDSMTDVPTLTSATAANYCTINSLLDTQTYATYSEGNLKVVTTAAGGYAMRMFSKGTMQIPSAGKWYFTINAADCAILIGNDTGNRTQYGSVLSTTQVRYASDGTVLLDGGVVTTVASYTSTDEVGLAVDMDSSTVGIYKNGSLLYTVTSAITAGFAYYPMTTVNSSSTPYTAYWNFGQRPFSYTPPTGFKALNTFNLPDPTIKKPNQYMDATTYTGNGGTQSIVNAAGFQPDFVWMKARSINYDNTLQDSTRGTSAYLFSNTTAAEGTTSNLIQSFNANGFTAGSSGNINQSGQTYVGWQWKKGATPGFDIVTYTGTETNRTVNHSLGVAPKMLICKVRDYAPEGWFVWHSALSGTEFLQLNTTDAKGTATNLWNSAIPTSSSFSLGTSASANRNGKNFVAYLFAEIPGFSKFGYYTGNGSADGPFVYCGFRPRWVMVKSTGASNWFVWDTERNRFNATTTPLFPNGSSAEEATLYPIDVLSNGFKLRGAAGLGINESATYIFAAFAETPFKTALAR